MAAAGSCSCELNLGCHQVSTQDILHSQDLERKCKLVDETINFLGASNSHEQCTLQDKINELKEVSGKYYFDKDEKIIVIPNQVELPMQPFILDNHENEKEISIFLDKYCEDLLHQNFIVALRNKQIVAFIIKGFQSGDVLRAKVEKGKSLRGKDICADLNKYEKEIMEILEIKKISEVKLSECIELHNDLKNNMKSSTWLFKKGYMFSINFKPTIKIFYMFHKDD